MSSVAPQNSRRTDPRERALTWGAALLTVAAPALVGGVHPATQVALGAAALALFGIYVVLRGRRGFAQVPFAGAAALALAFTVLQIVPLPAPIVSALSPHAYELRSDVAPDARWMPLSVDTAATWLACARGIGCIALLLLVAGLVRSRRHARWLLTVVAATSAGLAIVAAAQRISGTGAILGFYHPRSQPGFGVFGTFVDVNHAASLLTLGSLVAAGLAAESRGPRRSLFVTLAVVSVVAVLFTTSRGSLLGLAAGAFLLTTVLTARSIGLARALVAASVLLLAASATALWSNQELRHRVADRPQELVENQKTRGWIDGLRLALAYRWTGVGRGAFEAAIGGYRTDDEGVSLAYPEDVFVQMASEWGFPLTFTLLVMIVGTAIRMAPGVARASPAVAAGACGVIAVLLHELFDFGLEFPGVAYPTIVALATVAGSVAADGRSREARGYRVPLHVTAPLVGVAALVLVVAGIASRHTIDADFARLHRGVESQSVDDAALQAAIARHPAYDYFELLSAERALKNGRADAMHHINRALRLHPANWQAHRMAAFMLVAMKRPAQAALEYRLASEHGMSIDVAELVRVLRVDIVDAVPQTPERLMALARGLYGLSRPTEADAAAQRAVELSQPREAVLMQRTQLALDANASQVLGAAAHALVAEAESSDAFALAARALARVNSMAESTAAVMAGLRRHPGDASLFLVAAELRLAVNDLAGARAMLGRAGESQLTLPQRERAEELLADIADRSGDSDTATIVRARSRLIAKQLHDMTLPGKAP